MRDAPVAARPRATADNMVDVSSSWSHRQRQASFCLVSATSPELAVSSPELSQVRDASTWSALPFQSSIPLPMTRSARLRHPNLRPGRRCLSLQLLSASSPELALTSPELPRCEPERAPSVEQSASSSARTRGPTINGLRSTSVASPLSNAYALCLGAMGIWAAYNSGSILTSLRVAASLC